MFDMLGMGGMGAPPDGCCWLPAGDLTAETRADIETGDTWETPKFGGGWLIRAVERFNFGILEPVDDSDDFGGSGEAICFAMCRWCIMAVNRSRSFCN